MHDLSTSTPKFVNEASLEEFVWQHLKFLGLAPLARQYYLQNQICDILALDNTQQIVIIELKNEVDRYLLPQLTRYYSAVANQKPFEDKVNYDLPVRLLAIAPTFHPHNSIDRDYNQLDFELMSFSVFKTADGYCLKLTDVDRQQSTELNIPTAFHPYLLTADGNPAAPAPTIDPPPNSLSKLLDGVSSQQRAHVLDIRERILRFDPQMSEVGKTTTTQYGLRKGTSLYKTKVCAEFIPASPIGHCPRLMLRLPHPKRKRMDSQPYYEKEPVKGLAWADVWRFQDALGSRAEQIFFFLNQSRIRLHSRYSRAYTRTDYAELYRALTGNARSLDSVEDLVDLALEEWRTLVDA